MALASKSLPWVLLLAAAGGLAHVQGRQRPEVIASGGEYRLPPPRLAVNSSLVELEVVVRGPDGAPVGGLERSNFEVAASGRAQNIAFFSELRRTPLRPRQDAASVPAHAKPAAAPPAASSGTPPPRFIALYFDDINTDKADLGLIRLAALRFLQSDFNPSDRIAVLAASGAPVAAFTGDLAVLAKEIAAIRPHPRASPGGFLECPRITDFQAYQITVVHDPLALQAARAERAACNGGSDSGSGYFDKGSEPVLAQAEATWDQARNIAQDTLVSITGAVKLLSAQPGQRILLLTTGGFLADTLEEQQDEIVQQALRAKVVINALDATGLAPDGPGRPLSETSAAGNLPLPTFYYEETSKFPRRQAKEAALANFSQSTGGLLFRNNQ